MLTVAGRALLLISGLIGFAAVLWPSGHRSGNRVEKHNQSALSTCPLGFGGSDASGGESKEPYRGPSFSPHSVALGLGATSSQARAKPLPEPYRLFFNGTIWTGQEQPSGQRVPFATAMLVHRGGVVAVGSLEEVRRAVPPGALVAGEAAEWAGRPGSGGGEDARLVEHDLAGGFVMPGFVDAHVHVVPGGLSLGRVDLGGASSRSEVAARVAHVAARLQPGEWLLGGQWDEVHWGGELPSADWLDEVCGGSPAYLTRHDLHMALANTAALQLAGVGSDTRDPDGGIVDRDPATGRPTGLLRERAMNLVEAAVPQPSVSERRAALVAAAQLALSRGVTTLVDMGRYFSGDPERPWSDLEEVYMPAADAGALPVRLFTHVPLATWRRLAAWIAAHGRAHPGGRLFWGGLEEFADGSLGSHTALMWSPYSDGGNSGGGGSEGDAAAKLFEQRAMGMQELGDLAVAAVAAGLQVSVHAIGDRAVDEVVTAYEAALAAVVERSGGSGETNAPATDPYVDVDADGSGPEERQRRLGQSLRLRIEHAQHLSSTATTAAALARSGVTPVVNLLHLLTDLPMLLPRLGPERAPRSFALASLLATGLRPALASDWPVVDLQPVTSVYAAVHRHAPPPAVVCAMHRVLPPAARFQVVGVVKEAEQGDACCQDSGDGGNGDEGGNACCSAEAAEARSWPHPFTPEERLSLEAALLGHTAWAARAAGLEDYVGSLAPGRRADFVELSGGLTEEVLGGGGVRLSEDRLRRCLPVVLRTWVDGELSYDIAAGVGGSMAQVELASAR